MTEDFAANIPALDDLKTRFAFIDNPTLQENATIYFQYIIFLLALSEDEKVPSDYFKKEDVEQAFKNAHDIIVRVESVLKG